MPNDFRHLGHEGYARLPYRGADALWPDPPEIRYALMALPKGEGTPAVYEQMGRDYLMGWKEAHEAAEAVKAAKAAAEAPPEGHPRPQLTITHTSQDGTMLEGSSKGDGAWEAIRAAQKAYRIRGWRFMPSIRAIAVSHSRDRAPDLGNIDRTAEVLHTAGFEVTVEVDGTPRAMEETEADRAERMDDRADALTAKADRKSSEADGRWKAGQEIADAIPAGQPILRGHHSERGHRRALARMDGHQRASLALEEEAKRAADGAASAQRHMEARENPRRVYRRIKTLKADLGRTERALTGHRTRHLDGNGQPVYVFDHAPAEGRRREQHLLSKVHLEEQIRYWTEALDAAKAAGADVPPDPDQIKKGYWVKSWAGWNEVVRVNKVSVTVLSSYGKDSPTFPRKVTFDDVKAIRETSPFAPVPDEQAVELDAAVQA